MTTWHKYCLRTLGHIEAAHRTEPPSKMTPKQKETYSDIMRAMDHCEKHLLKLTKASAPRKRKPKKSPSD